MCFKKERFSNFLFCSLVTLVVGMFYFFNKPNSLSQAGFWSILYLSLFLFFFLIIYKYRFFSFPVIFSLLTWIFHFGFFVIYFFHKENVIFANDFIYYDDELILKTFDICLLFYSFLAIGLLWPIKATNNHSEIRRKQLPNANYSILKYIFIACYIIYIADLLLIVSYGGYYSSYGRVVSSIVGYSTDIMIAVAIILFDKAIKENKKKQMFVLFLLFIPAIFTGNRFYSICVLITFFLMVCFSKKIKARHLFVFLIAAFAGLYVINTIGNYRSDFAVMMAKFFDKENISNYIDKNPIITLLEEFGGTITSLLASIKNINGSSFFAGKTYFLSLLLIVPGLSSFAPSEYLLYTSSFPDVDQHHLGGSFFGEAYANFGVFGFFLILVLGIIIKRLYLEEKKCRLENSLFSSWVYIMYFCLLTLVRGYFKNCVFLGVWCFALVYYLSTNHKARGLVLLSDY